jgi:23S rRNA (cytosine1962-C5)-methyltransferase
MAVIQLKAGREKALLRGHPWIFSGSITKSDKDDGEPQAGETVKIVDSSRQFLAWGSYSPESKIKVRVWSRNQGEKIDREFFLARLEKTIHLRRRFLLTDEFTAYRLVHAESDGLPGLIVDRYADTLVVQFLTCGAEYWRETFVELIARLIACDYIYERSDVDVRRLEGLTPRKGPLVGEDDLELIQIQEGDMRYWVDICHGQKTGFYLDQRENRSEIRKLADDQHVLDCFAYTGGFSISALIGGAKSVVAVESSSEAIKLGQENIALNRISANKIEWIESDVFKVLRQFRDGNKKFEMVILDPPKFAPTATHAHRAARGYKDINLLAMKLLNPGGLLVTFSCSGGISEHLFQKILAGAAIDAGVNAKIMDRLGPGADHPVALNFPEGAYLKGFVIQV